MDESKLSKSDANRKPREAYLHIANDNYYTAEQFAEELKRDPRMAKSYLHFREVLPQDDSIRVSREDWEEIKVRMEYTNSYPRKSCAEFLKRIERESRGEG